MATANLSGADYQLVRGLEYGHADSGLACARAYSGQNAEAEIAFEQIAGGWAIYQGLDSPLTQALAVGMRGTVAPEEMARLERFFHSRGSPAVIDLASMADPCMLGLLQTKGLVVREIGNVLARRLRTDEEFAAYPDAGVEQASEGELREWARLVIRGFTEQEEVADQQVSVVAAVPPTLRPYFACWNGERAAGAAMTVFDGLGTFVGDATLRAARRSGLQFALIIHRLREASAMGCDLASATVIPGSGSHRNYERAGFQLIYSRVQVAIPTPQ